MAKDKEWSGLLKIPTELVISQLRIELGKQASYITELEDLVKKVKAENERKEIKQTKLDDLELKYSKALEKIDYYKDRTVVLTKQLDLLQKQLLNTIH